MSEDEEWTLEELVNERKVIDDEEASIAEAKKKINQMILDKMEELGVDKEKVDDARVTVVRPSDILNYDWDFIRSHVDAQTWKRITTEVPNMDLLEKAIAEGRIPQEVIDDAVFYTPGAKTHVKVAFKK